MSYDDMTVNRYGELYARFLKRSSNELIDEAGLKPGDRFLDLCAGSCRGAIAAAERGAAMVMAVDSSRGMFPTGSNVIELSGGATVSLVLSPVELFLRSMIKPFENMFNVIFCQQAVNYWLTKETAFMVADVMEDDGRFVFNTFNEKPLQIPTVKEYKFGGNSFVEISYVIDDMVYHVQTRNGLAPDVEKFRWISREEFGEILLGAFGGLKEVKQGKTTIYVASKPKR